jgi:hypothetical protein
VGEATVAEAGTAGARTVTVALAGMGAAVEAGTVAESGTVLPALRTVTLVAGCNLTVVTVAAALRRTRTSAESKRRDACEIVNCTLRSPDRQSGAPGQALLRTLLHPHFAAQAF